MLSNPRTLRDMTNDLRKAQELGNDSVRTFFAADSEEEHSNAAYLERMEEPIESLKVCKLQSFGSC
jgi:hypothetical protein